MLVMLNSMDKIKNFVDVVSSYESDVDLSSGKFVVDAKSILGILSLNLSKPLKVVVQDSSFEEKILNAISVFRA